MSDAKVSAAGSKPQSGGGGSVVGSTVIVPRDINDVIFYNVKYTVDAKPDPILYGISGKFEKNCISTIMGPSGSGKTTLLDILAQRSAATGHVSGTLPAVSAENTGYVTQDIVLPIQDTVFNVLMLYAELTLNVEFTTEERVTRVNNIIEMLNLSHVRDSIIGGVAPTGDSIAGLSGGEKRRCLIGASLVKEPRLLLLDEPTTGLDAHMALDVVKAMRKLADSTHGVTIALTLHQPRVEIWYQLDRILLLVKGSRVFDGSPREASTFLTDTLGVSINDDMSPADFVLDHFSQMDTNDAAEVQEKFEAAYADQLVTEAEAIESAEKERTWTEANDAEGRRANFFLRWGALIRREWRITQRERMQILIQMCIATGIYLLVSLPFFKSFGDPYSKTHNHFSGLALLVITATFTALPAVPAITFGRRLYLYERAAGLYGCAEWYFTVVLKDLIIKLFRSGIQWVIMFSFIQTTHSATQFFFGWLCIYLANIVPISYTFFVASLSFDTTTAIAILMHINMCFVLFASFYIPVEYLPKVSRWIVYVNPMYYIVSSVEQNAYGFDINPEECLVETAENEEACIGLDMLASHKFDEFSKGADVFAALVFWLAFHFSAGMVLQFYNYNVDLVIDAEKDDSVSLPPDEEKPLLDLSGNGTARYESADRDFRLEPLALEQPVRWLDITCTVKVMEANENVVDKQLLYGVSGEVKVGTMCAIMGPSGAGKSTLLDILAGRYPSGGVTTGSVPDVKDLRQGAVAYVTQDEVLSPSETLAETLTFYAELSMDKDLSKAMRGAFIMRILRDMMLEHVKDTAVGGVMSGGLVLRGVSGGEKRRLSIAAALLQNPSLLLLDEPTSGLDSGASLEVANVLTRLARRGVTIISTIHQPRLEIWRQFDHVVLLAKGRTVFEGMGKAAERLIASVHREPLEAENPPDFVLDFLNTYKTSDEALELQRVWEKNDGVVEYSRGGTVEIGRNDSTGPNVIAVDNPFNDLMANKDQAKRMNLANRMGVLLRRQFRTVFRLRQSWVSIYMAVGIKCVLIVLATFRLSKPPYLEDEVMSRLGLILFIVMQCYSISAGTVALFQRTRALYFHERSMNLYGATEYFFSTLLIDMFFFAMIPGFIITTVAVFAAQWALHPASRVVFAICVGIASSLAGHSMYTVCGVSLPNPMLAGLVANLAEISSTLFMGFFIRTQDLRMWIKWITLFYPTRFSYHAFVIAFFRNVAIECSDGTTETCSQGNEVIEYWDADRHPDGAGKDYIILVFYILGLYLAAFVILATLGDRIRTGKK